MEWTENVLERGDNTDPQKENTTSSGHRKKLTYEDRLLGILDSKVNKVVHNFLVIFQLLKNKLVLLKLEAPMDVLTAIKRITIPRRQYYNNRYPYTSYLGHNNYQVGTYFCLTQLW